MPRERVYIYELFRTDDFVSKELSVEINPDYFRFSVAFVHTSYLSFISGLEGTNWGPVIASTLKEIQEIFVKKSTTEQLVLIVQYEPFQYMNASGSPFKAF